MSHEDTDEDTARSMTCRSQSMYGKARITSTPIGERISIVFSCWARDVFILKCTGECFRLSDESTLALVRNPCERLSNNDKRREMKIAKETTQV